MWVYMFWHEYWLIFSLLWPNTWVFRRNKKGQAILVPFLSHRVWSKHNASLWQPHASTPAIGWYGFVLTSAFNSGGKLRVYLYTMEKAWKISCFKNKIFYDAHPNDLPDKTVKEKDGRIAFVDVNCWFIIKPNCHFFASQLVTPKQTRTKQTRQKVDWGSCAPSFLWTIYYWRSFWS